MSATTIYIKLSTTLFALTMEIVVLCCTQIASRSCHKISAF